MKKIFILLIPLFFIFSCTEEKETNTQIWKEQTWVIEESSEIISDYVDILEWTIIDAKKIKNQIETDQNKLKNELNNIR
jgi:hypothetical protein